MTNANQYRLHTFIHKIWVLHYLLLFSLRLLWRGIVHDFSKLSKFEAEGYGECLPKFRQTSYGSEGYQELLSQLHPVLDHHYKHNRHHPEHFQGGYTDMNLLDIVEMLCDWRASVKRQKDGDIMKSIRQCRKRFRISDDLAKIFMNTVRKSR